ncbi:Erythromycin esterase homolog [Halopseudomonas xinjiangensis]|uniref:Erythromycin esterase homolog n=1 Tax=Halopseudomonas xinjiangensis TaxID=487184 RepID=A0A1H1MU10_9GAMM|nr:erythromycin esterase family protein [Halopseudomonas xinjiangensis]SDR90186.1 Erythromycin esterase homolog [Halopseudomonas xinjiangensis]
MSSANKAGLPRFALHRPAELQVDAVPLLRQYAEPLPDLESEEFAAMFDRYGAARIVLIGEASHGTSEFYRTRAAISRALIERHGFNIVAAEADWPDAGRIDAYVRRSATRQWHEQAFRRFPAWMWKNAEIVEFADWLRDYNAPRADEQRVAFRGLDVYSLCDSIGQVLQYLDQTDTTLARQARERYACLSPWQDDPVLYGHMVERDGKDPCEDAIVEQLQALLKARLAGTPEQHEEHFSATQNARVIRAAEQYYRSIYRGSAESWNLRDQHMFDTLEALLEQRGSDAKIIVWAHNSHIGDARATSMGWGGRFNIGQLCRAAFGSEAVLIGMGTDRGQVAAADEWDGVMHIKDVVPSRPDSWEQQFLQAGIPASLTDWRGSDRKALRDALGQPLLARAIGVIYRPESERRSHYSQAVLAEQFDSYVWLEKTGAVTPLAHSTDSPSEADTYPYGV